MGTVKDDLPQVDDDELRKELRQEVTSKLGKEVKFEPMKERARQWKADKCEELSSTEEVEQNPQEPRTDYDNPEVADEKLN